MKKDIKKAIEVLRKASENHSQKVLIEGHLSFIEEKFFPLSLEDWLENEYDLFTSDTLSVEVFIEYLNEYNNYLKSFNEEKEQDKELKIIEVKRTDYLFLSNFNCSESNLEIKIIGVIGDECYVDLFQIYVHKEKGLIAEDEYHQEWNIKEIEVIRNTQTNQIYKLID